ncbi:MAG TPA: hypothetical protein VKP67_00070 [Xanthobacteraceae bacterium]|nr:hypothetical protein [Xanthobacteraceae bacterium]
MREAFLERVQDGAHRDPAVDPEQIARAVLALIEARLPARGEAQHVKCGCRAG